MDKKFLLECLKNLIDNHYKVFMDQSELRALSAGCECQEKIACNQRLDGIRLKRVIEWVRIQQEIVPGNCEL